MECLEIVMRANDQAGLMGCVEVLSIHVLLDHFRISQIQVSIFVGDVRERADLLKTVLLPSQSHNDEVLVVYRSTRVQLVLSEIYQIRHSTTDGDVSEKTMALQKNVFTKKVSTDGVLESGQSVVRHVVKVEVSSVSEMMEQKWLTRTVQQTNLDHRCRVALQRRADHRRLAQVDTLVMAHVHHYVDLATSSVVIKNPAKTKSHHTQEGVHIMVAITVVGTMEEGIRRARMDVALARMVVIVLIISPVRYHP